MQQIDRKDIIKEQDLNPLNNVFIFKLRKILKGDVNDRSISK